MRENTVLTADEARRITFSRAIRYITEQIFTESYSGKCTTDIFIPADEHSELYELVDGYSVELYIKEQNGVRKIGKYPDKLIALMTHFTKLGYIVTIDTKHYDTTMCLVHGMVIKWTTSDDAEPV